MKNIKIKIIALTLIVVTAVSCNNSSKKNNSKTNNETNGTIENVVNKKFSIEPIVTDYLNLKNALVVDNSKKSAEAGKQLLEALKSVDMSVVPSDKYNEFMEIADDARENSEHIGDN